MSAAQQMGGFEPPADIKEAQNSNAKSRTIKRKQPGLAAV